jgi:hypothetical protein
MYVDRYDPPTAAGGFNPYAAGQKYYGGGRSAPNIGPVDPAGYRTRDRLAQAKRNAMLRRLQAGMGQQYMNPDWLRGSVQ